MDIDFDEAHTAWMANKIRKPNSAMTYYRCEAITKTGKPCVRAAVQTIHAKLCKMHHAYTSPPSSTDAFSKSLKSSDNA